MLSIAELVTQLYPEKEPEPLQYVADLVAENFDEFYTHTWNEIQREDLLKENIQVRLVKTLFHSQFTYDGVVSMILQSLLDWSGGDLVFEDFDEDVAAFYERLFTFLGFVNFAWISHEQQSFLLQSRCLVLAAVWNVSLYVNVQNYFARISSIVNMYEETDLFAFNIRKNESFLRGTENSDKTVAYWVNLFDVFVPGSIENKIPEFLSDTLEVTRLPEDTRKFLDKILAVYWGLQTGVIYREVTAEDALPAGMERQAPPTEKKSQEDYYIDLLYAFPKENFNIWLKDYEATAYWLIMTEKPPAFIRKILFVLLEKIDLTNIEEVQLVQSFFGRLAEGELEGIDGVLYYDESDSQFHWDEDYFYLEDASESEKKEPPRIPLEG